MNNNRRSDAQLIATIPGIGFYGALLIRAEIDDIHRFPRPENLCAYQLNVDLLYLCLDVLQPLHTSHPDDFKHYSLAGLMKVMI